MPEFFAHTRGGAVVGTLALNIFGLGEWVGALGDRLPAVA